MKNNIIKKQHPLFELTNALDILKDASKKFRKFDESVDIECRFDFSRLVKKSNFKGSSLLPYGSGQKRCIAVFYDDKSKYAELKKLGADYIFYEDFLLLLKEKKKLPFTHLITVERLFEFLRSYTTNLASLCLLPSVKNGLLTTDTNLFLSVNNCKYKNVNYQIDSLGFLRCSIGRISFTVDFLEKNIYSLLFDVFKNNFSQFYFDFLKIVRLSTTMGKSYQLSLDLMLKKFEIKKI